MCFSDFKALTMIIQNNFKKGFLLIHLFNHKNVWVFFNFEVSNGTIPKKKLFYTWLGEDIKLLCLSTGSTEWKPSFHGIDRIAANITDAHGLCLGIWVQNWHRNAVTSLVVSCPVNRALKQYLGYISSRHYWQSVHSSIYLRISSKLFAETLVFLFL